MQPSASGAGLVISEMTASECLLRGRREARQRAQGQGVGLHVVQLAGCEAKWMAEGAPVQVEADQAALRVMDGRQPDELAGEVPERDVDAGNRFELVAGDVAPGAHAAVHPLPVPFDGERVLADEQRREDVLDHGGRGARPERRVTLAPPDGAVLGGDLDEAGLGLRRVDADVAVADLGQGAPLLRGGVGRRSEAGPSDVIFVAHDDERLDGGDASGWTG